MELTLEPGEIRVAVMDIEVERCCVGKEQRTKTLLVPGERVTVELYPLTGTTAEISMPSERSNLIIGKEDLLKGTVPAHF
jgi:hypothetical protein